jgi:hypothetical protein
MRFAQDRVTLRVSTLCPCFIFTGHNSVSAPLSLKQPADVGQRAPGNSSLRAVPCSKPSSPWAKGKT